MIQNLKINYYMRDSMTHRVNRVSKWCGHGDIYHSIQRAKDSVRVREKELLVYGLSGEFSSKLAVVVFYTSRDRWFRRTLGKTHATQQWRYQDLPRFFGQESRGIVPACTTMKAGNCVRWLNATCFYARVLGYRSGSWICTQPSMWILQPRRSASCYTHADPFLSEQKPLYNPSETRADCNDKLYQSSQLIHEPRTRVRRVALPRTRHNVSAVSYNGIDSRTMTRKLTLITVLNARCPISLRRGFQY